MTTSADAARVDLGEGPRAAPRKLAVPVLASMGHGMKREMPLLMVALGWGVLLAIAAAVAVLCLVGSLEPTVGLAIVALALGQGALVTGLALLVMAELRRQGRVPERGAKMGTPGSAQTMAAAAAPELLATGDMNGRRFALFSDGSVELLTLLGRRRFRTIALAREFVGGASSTEDC
jgi:hypothetical protein